jgi:ubiquinone/menaquinone biosynthesis C-methylase UbiE
MDRYVPALGLHVLTRYYDPVVALTTRERRVKRTLVEQTNLGAKMSVLDLACGTGTLAIWMKRAEPAAYIHGIDADPEALAIARDKARLSGAEIELHRAFSTELPFANCSFDRVTSSLFFHHLRRADKFRTMKEAYRVLRPGGQLHIADWGPPSNLLMRLAHVPVQLLDGWSNTQDNLQGVLAELMSEAGFVDVRETANLVTVFGTVTLHAALRRP